MSIISRPRRRQPSLRWPITILILSCLASATILTVFAIHHLAPPAVEPPRQTAASKKKDDADSKKLDKLVLERILLFEKWHTIERASVGRLERYTAKALAALPPASQGATARSTYLEKIAYEEAQRLASSRQAMAESQAILDAAILSSKQTDADILSFDAICLDLRANSKAIESILRRHPDWTLPESVTSLSLSGPPSRP